MMIKMAVSLAFLTALFFVGFKSISNPDSAMIGMTILCYGWVATQIIGEGFIAIAWLILKHGVEKTLDKDIDDDDV